MNLSTLAVGGALLLMTICVYIYEHRKIKSMELAVIVSLAVVAGISRIPFAGIPSVQPTTFIVLLSGYVFGPFMGCVIGFLAAWISNFFLLHGPWTIWQMFAWGLVGLSGGFAGRVVPVPLRDRFLNKKRLNLSRLEPVPYVGAYSNTLLLLILGFVWGFLFGWLMNLWYWMAYAYPLNFNTWLSVNVSSFLFESAHAGANVVLILFFGKPLLKILFRFRNKLYPNLEK